MGKGIRLIMTQVIEYEPNPEHYPKGLTIEDMAKLDAENEDIDLIFENAETTVTYEITDID